jgi:hypothetical protein
MDHDAILSCLTDDVVWDIAGMAHLEGKQAYDAEIDNPEFVGAPTLNFDRMFEDGNVVVAIGDGMARRADGIEFRFAACDVFTFRGDLVCWRESYLVPLTSAEG